MTLSTRYNPQETEQRWYQHWLDNNYFHSVPDDREPFTIVIPPPNVTGVLHMGHMLNNTIQDILIRKARLDGKNACWVPGTDHASIATEAKVVQWLRKEKNLRKVDITRDQFMEYAYQWKDKYGGIILQQLRRLGASCDWNRTAFTMDPGYYSDVIRVFVDLYQKDKLYRGLRMVNWDPEAKTVLSNEEVIYKEEQSQFYHIRYKGEDGSEGVVIATQRPETIFADVAIAVHPKDERYQSLVGKNVLIPLINRAIPVIADEYVDIAFGTGALKITPAHDPNDYEIGLRHNLPVIDTIADDGRISEACTYEPIVGLDRFDARKHMKPALEESGCLVKIEDYTTNIGRSERTNAVVEPKLSLQWFVNMTSLREPALKAVAEEEIKFYPPSFQNLYRNWMENLRDWCISRQLWWGHRIPAWYLKSEAFNKETYIFVAASAEEALEIARQQTGNAALTLDDLRQDEDVLDTWASSWLWPISVFDGFNQPDGEIKYYYPTSLLVTGWDIIFFWVARMIMAGYEFKGQRPFNAVYFTGMVRDKQRRKMSKSLGNSPDALQLIDDYGADGVRYGLLSSSPAGGDLLFDDKLCETGRNFCNKLWNALRLVKGWEIAPQAVDSATAVNNQLAADWLHQKLQSVISQLDELLADYRLSEALMLLYKFIWDDFCSWYLEMIKPGFGQPIDQTTYDRTLDAFEVMTTLLHPFMPFVTEEIWHQLRDRLEGEDCIAGHWPAATVSDAALINKVEEAKSVVSSIREIRNNKGIKIKDQLSVFVQDTPAAQALLGTPGIREMITKMANLEKLETSTGEVTNSVSFLAGAEKFFVVLNQQIDHTEERERLLKELAYHQGFVNSVEKKLSNERFVNSAPANVVEMERKKLADGQAKVKNLEEALAQLGLSS
ncbi:MAG: valine--tRNA ligase [Saprospiraceae bacterium]|nr:valine--tRNA ligase [Saprospiraceae bacterium]